MLQRLFQNGESRRRTLARSLSRLACRDRRPRLGRAGPVVRAVALLARRLLPVPDQGSWASRSRRVGSRGRMGFHDYFGNWLGRRMSLCYRGYISFDL